MLLLQEMGYPLRRGHGAGSKGKTTDIKKRPGVSEAKVTRDPLGPSPSA